MTTLCFISSYGQDCSWVKDYTDNFVIWEQHGHIKNPLPHIKVSHMGSDIHDKFSWIIQNYENLPEIVIMLKANLFKYITREEFDKVKDNKIFTPLLTQNHKVYEPICRYVDGMYEEINNRWYLASHPCKNEMVSMELMVMLGISDKQYVRFAPGSNYILPKENILKHSKEFYQKLRSYLEWDVYPGEAQLMERGLYYLWK